MGRLQQCPCGSGHFPWELTDARGIFCSYVCQSCEAKVRAKYRPDIFTDSQYWADEQIEPEE